MKICIKCNLEKLESDFKKKSKKCIECYKSYQANYRFIKYDYSSEVSISCNWSTMFSKGSHCSIIDFISGR